MPIIKIEAGKVISYPDFCPVCEKQGKLKRLLVGSADMHADKKRNAHKYRELHIPIHTSCRSLRELKAVLGTVTALVLTIVTFHYFFNAYGYSYDIFFYIIGIPIYLVIRKLNPMPIEIDFYEGYISFDFKSEKYALEFNKLNEKSIHGKV